MSRRRVCARRGAPKTTSDPAAHAGIARTIPAHVGETVRMSRAAHAASAMRKSVLNAQSGLGAHVVTKMRCSMNRARVAVGARSVPDAARATSATATTIVSPSPAAQSKAR